MGGYPLTPVNAECDRAGSKRTATQPVAPNEINRVCSRSIVTHFVDWTLSQDAWRATGVACT
ncbi:hypothetical protein HaLaN_08407 [Haematococcus lacustris]|uniref:Uncharacterized protein n=1 Tax=Haematococcus lacustris TaxID=44745 RepID=A0A699YZ40_HAELA|nr:hypothetical protein HaLaN_08407 [Haematococcus lacustris]